MFVVLLLAVSACVTGTGSLVGADTPVIPELDRPTVESTVAPGFAVAERSRYVESVLDDGTVTSDELAQAYDDLVACLAEGGGTGTYAYDLAVDAGIALNWHVVGDDAAGTKGDILDHRCRFEYIGELDDVYLQARPDDFAGLEIAKERFLSCLNDAGLLGTLGFDGSESYDAMVSTLRQEALGLGGSGSQTASECTTSALHGPWHTFGVEASQTPSDAARDGVIPGVARLPFDVRVGVVAPQFAGALTRIVTSEGVWIVSSPDIDALGEGTLFGDPDGAYGRDFVVGSTYSEVLLLDRSESRIVRAFPIAPSAAPGAIAVSPAAVYCHRAADGGEPDSMLCRIDRSTLTMSLRLFSGPGGTSFEGDDAWLPAGWVIGNPVDASIVGRLETDGGLRVVSADQTFVFDPDTLELVDRIRGQSGHANAGA